MTDRLRPEVVVFDVVETFASLAPVRERLRELEQPPDVLARWFTRLIRDRIALTAAGSYAGFADVAASALGAETHQVLSAEQITAPVTASASSPRSRTRPPPSKPLPGPASECSRCPTARPPRCGASCSGPV